MRPSFESVHGTLASDGHRVQCHECGEWFAALDSHIRHTHGSNADAYRKEWGLAPEVSLVADETQVRARANALQRIDQAGPLNTHKFVAGTYPQDGDVAVEYDSRARTLWKERLGASGWSSWQDAVDWALDNNKTWPDIAARIGVTTQETRNAGMAVGTVLPPKWQRMLALAEAHVADTGTLLDATGPLAAWLNTSRGHLKSGDAPLAAKDRLDQLDPDWQLDHAARIAAAHRRGITDSKLTGSPFAQIVERIQFAGFDDITAFVRWAVTSGQTTASMGERVDIRGEDVIRLVTDDNPVDPFVATAEFRLSTYGHLEDNGHHLQCHDCGIWFQRLSQHLTGHRDDAGDPLTPASYRERHGLDDDTRLSTSGADDRPSSHWSQRLAIGGFDSWPDVVAFAARARISLAELGDLLGARSDAVGNALKAVDPAAVRAAVGEFQLSVPGTLATDGDYSQCHECSLWFTRLSHHVSYTYESYQRAHGLGLSSRFATWSDALAFAATEYLNPAELAEHLGMSEFAVLEALADLPDSAWNAARPIMESVDGHLGAHGSRAQCHECGFWFGALDQHVRTHRGSDGRHLETLNYQRRHGLPEGSSLRSVWAGYDDVWAARIADAGFASFDDALVAAARNHDGLAELSVAMGVKREALIKFARSLKSDDPWAATLPYRESRDGFLASDGDRVQCHDCGLWFETLAPHVKLHSGADGESFTAVTYRKQHGLAPKSAIAVPSKAKRERMLNRVKAAGYGSWESFMVAAVKRFDGVAQMADEIGSGREEVWSYLVENCGPDWPLTQSMTVSKPGFLAESHDRLQCHVCGLWFAGLASHVPLHNDANGVPFTSASYRKQFDLDDDVSLSLRVPKGLGKPR
ncbi:MAG: MucR family transcriptional regulator [Gordonia sp. (in: high G+C Gram-positive bacteria)]|uniref:MucR family transcriptional regulator n=1 Tax=Gordonia sp. (in: high G+C Gram-positive bacteria) TaxID=84139 RepID=UPI003C71D05A